MCAGPAFPHRGDLFSHMFSPCEGGAESICHVRRGIKGGDERWNNHLKMNKEDKYLQERAADLGLSAFSTLSCCFTVSKGSQKKKPQWKMSVSDGQ